MATFNDTFLKACRGESVPYTPVWYMRQAGRYQPEYREIRKKYSFFEVNENPEVCAEVTRLPVEQLGVDAAILFADIMTPLKAVGVPVDIVEGVGPVIDTPIKNVDDVRKINAIHPKADLPAVLETIQLLREQLNVPLIGFSGAPFTLASYLIEGGPSKGYHLTKGLMYKDPETWRLLMDKLADITIEYLSAQIDAGAQAVQVFDSWVGALGKEDYERFILPTMHKIFDALKSNDVPTIYFGSGAGHLLPLWGQLSADVLSVDWRIDLKSASAKAPNKVLQGNLDPSKLLAPWEMLKSEAEQVLNQGNSLPGHIFNLGHGIFPQADVQVLKKLTEHVHTYTKNTNGGTR